MPSKETTRSKNMRRRAPVVSDEGSSDGSPTSPIAQASRQRSSSRRSAHRSSTSTSSSHHKAMRKSDSRVLRGAEIIRRQLQQQMDAKERNSQLNASSYEIGDASLGDGMTVEDQANFLSLLELNAVSQMPGSGETIMRKQQDQHMPENTRQSTPSTQKQKKAASSFKRKATAVRHEADGGMRSMPPEERKEELSPSGQSASREQQKAFTQSSISDNSELKLHASLRQVPDRQLTDSHPDWTVPHKHLEKNNPVTPSPSKGEDEMVSHVSGQSTYMGRDRRIKTKATTYFVDHLNPDFSNSLETSTDTEFEELLNSRSMEKVQDGGYDDMVQSDYDEIDVDNFANLKSSLSNITSSYPSRTRQVNSGKRTQKSTNEVSGTGDIDNIGIERDDHRQFHLFLDETNQIDLDSRHGPPSLSATSEDSRPNQNPTQAIAAPRKGKTGRRISSENTSHSPSYPLPSTVLSPLSREYVALMTDPPFKHAQSAGNLWQSLVGMHVRFPDKWWNGARVPPLGCWLEKDGELEDKQWKYCGRHQVRSHSNLNKLVRHRGSPGRLLLHLVVLDLVTRTPVRDVAVGCFHPNARGIRSTDQADLSQEDSRDLWWAVRRRAQSVSVVDHMLLLESQGRSNSFSSFSSCEDKEELRSKTPLGPNAPRVTNYNMKAIFGEQPPLETIFIVESEIYELLATGGEALGKPPAVALIDEFVF